MQSGILVSQELQSAFHELTSSAGLQPRGLIASIAGEQIIPTAQIPLRSQEFLDDLEQLETLLKPDEAAYIILRRFNTAPNGLVAVTYVPDVANVRQKMLFAASRLTLVRDLGAERFRETLFATTKDELTPDGWRKHDRLGVLEAPLTDEESTLQGVRRAEAEASRGTSARSSHVSNGLSFPVSPEALQALRRLQEGPESLIQLRIDITRESVELASATAAQAEEITDQISSSEPRFSFFRYQHGDGGAAGMSIVFIYTCPNASIKERMLYASSRQGIISRANEDAGLVITKKIEASSPAEVTAATLHEEFHPKTETKQGFARPKRPGRVT